MKFLRDPDPLVRLNPSESTVYQGDAAAVLKQLPDCFFQCVVTSPPYWGLRDYGIDGQIGAEDEPQAYVEKLTSIFNEVRRVLCDDGTLWLNVGDTYTSGNRAYRAPDKKNPIRAMTYRAKTPKGLKPKDLVGIPWRLAFSLQDSGWFLRADIIWEKPNAMPESVKDRPTRSHEYVFLFSKTLRYHYNACKIAEANGRNRRTVWSIPTEPFPGAHFATFPPDLVEPCIDAGSSDGDWVLDPFFGSGTVGVVCEQYGRNYVGIEINPEYVSLALERIATTRPSLFSLPKAARLQPHSHRHGRQRPGDHRPVLVPEVPPTPATLPTATAPSATRVTNSHLTCRTVPTLGYPRGGILSRPPVMANDRILRGCPIGPEDGTYSS